jgi:hypothetical protein
MADLLTLPTLARWTQSDEAEVLADAFAADLIDKASQMICFIGGHDGLHTDAAGVTIPEWDLLAGPNQAPIDVQMVALQVIKRSYENPGQVIQEGNIGPLGGDRVADVQALFMDLTERERAIIAKYNPDGDPDGADGEGVIFTLATTRDDDMLVAPTATLYVSDDQQVNIDSTNAAPSWDIPLFNPGDPGDPANYDAGV